MGTVSLRGFVDQLSRHGGAINVNDLGQDLRQTLQHAGITQQDLVSVAGCDGQIRGHRELSRLFELVNGSASSGSERSNPTRQRDSSGTDSQTVSGKLYEALGGELLRTRREARARGVIHVGMRSASWREVAALRRGNARAAGGVHAISNADASGQVQLGGRRHDLSSANGRRGFRNALVRQGMARDIANEFVGLIGRSAIAVRDEVANLGLALDRTGTGALRANRLVLSGHGGGTGVSGDGGSLSFYIVGKLAQLFPRGATKIKHVVLSACFSGYARHVEQFRQIFPNLRSYAGYTGFSPKAEQSAPAHLSLWERMTDGDDPSQVDRFGANTATWNPADDYQGRPVGALSEAQRGVAELRERSYDLVRSGRRTVEQVRPQLNEYYTAVVDLLYHPQLPPERRWTLEAHRREVLHLRHPEARE